MSDPIQAISDGILAAALKLAAATRKEALEEAAQLVERRQSGKAIADAGGSLGALRLAEQTAAAIRALKEKI